MKNIKYILGLFVLIGLFTGCEDDPESVIDNSAKPIVTVASSTTSISESGSPTFEVTINFDKPIKNTTTFVATQIGGSASSGDFSSSPAVVPAYQTSATMEITVNDDIFVEGTEDVQLEISASNIPDIYEVVGKPTVSFSIENSTSNDFIFRMDWDGLYEDSNGNEHHFCDFDLDVELYDSSFNLLTASYSSCPEEIEISPGDLPDGDYWLVPSFWDVTTGVSPANYQDIPAVVTFVKPGIVLETIDLTTTWNTEDGGAIQGNPDAYLFKYILTVSGTNYKVTDSDTGTVVFQG